MTADPSQRMVPLTITLAGIRICQASQEVGPDPVRPWEAWAPACFISRAFFLRPIIRRQRRHCPGGSLLWGMWPWAFSHTLHFCTPGQMLIWRAQEKHLLERALWQILWQTDLPYNEKSICKYHHPPPHLVCFQTLSSTSEISLHLCLHSYLKGAPS